jgi:hypothetical protein
MKNLRLTLGDAFTRELKEEIHQLTMAGRWWLAYQLSGSDPKVLEALLDDAETKCDDGGNHRLAVFEDGSCINWHQGDLCVYYNVSNLLDRYDYFAPDRLSVFDEALADYPVIEKYRDLLTSDSAWEEDAG